MTFRTHSMVKATAATLDGDSPVVVSCHRHLGLASGVADGKTGLWSPVSRQGPVRPGMPAGWCDWAGGAAFLGRGTLERLAPCIIPKFFVIPTAVLRWC